MSSANEIIFTPASVGGVVCVEGGGALDARGFFGRVFCARAYGEHGLCSRFVQHSIAQNEKRGTLRGMHFQVSPHDEIKLVQCVRGAVFDVVVDVRRGSSTFGKWEGFDLSGDRCRVLYIPAGVAHGYMTLSDNAMLYYCMSVEYEPSASCGIRWDDPTVNIVWPFAPAVISERDRSLPLIGDLGSR